MRISARLAMDSPMPSLSAGFHGRNIVVRALSEASFEAECRDDYPVGALVRLRLPCAGVAMARVIEAGAGRLRCDFVNPLGQSRLAHTLGARKMLEAA